MLIAGNWKMNTDAEGAEALARGVVEAVGAPEDVQVAVCPPPVFLPIVGRAVQDTPVRLGAQTMHHESDGAYTGEVSATMLRSVQCRYVIVGHSERRQSFGETDESVNKKVQKAVASELVPIVCVGETQEQRQVGEAEDVVRRQVRRALSDVALSDPSRVVIAYEPVWAIGTGESATPEQAQEMHAFIRDLLREDYGGAIGDTLHILYGGSMKPHNAADLLGQPDINGGLIGGASLEADDFAAIVEAGEKVAA